jgi:hypothetical protein
MSTPKQFTHLRPLLFTIVYEILGSATESDDMLQDRNLWWGARGPGGGAGHQVSYLAQLVTGQASNALRACARRREDYVGPWLPEPLLIETIAMPRPMWFSPSRSRWGSRRPQGRPAFVAAGCKGRRMAPAMSTTPHAGTVKSICGRSHR